MQIQTAETSKNILIFSSCTEEQLQEAVPSSETAVNCLWLGYAIPIQ